MIPASSDPNIKACILVMPFTSGAMDAANWPPGLLDRAWQDREKRRKDNDADEPYVQVWDNSSSDALGPRGSIPLHGSVAYEFISGAERLSKAANTPWENNITLSSFHSIAAVEPRDYISKIAPRALLYLVAVEDAISGPYEAQRECFERAGEPKEFVTMRDHHIGNYFGDSFEANVEKQIEFLDKFL